MEPIDTLLIELKTINKEKEALEAKDKELRAELKGRMENDGLTDGYKNDIATVSYKTLKSVKIADESKLLDTLIEKQCVRYFAYDITPAFAKDVKDKKLTPEHGLFTEDEVTIETNNSIAIKFQ